VICGQPVPQTKYAQCGDLSLAYQVVGEGAIDLVLASSFVSHVELIWTSPEAKTFFDHLASFCRMLLFDKAGVGLSDPVPRVRSIDDRAAEIEAVMDAAGFGSAVLIGVSEGGPASIVFAAARPDRVKALILAGTFAYTSLTSLVSDDLDRSPEEVSECLREAVGDAMLISSAKSANLRAS
jgi:pimeloyl-ACP methyl ester carboxylesterase